MEFSQEIRNELRVRYELMDQRSSDNSEDKLRLSGPPSVPTGEVLSLWRLKILYVENDYQPYLVALCEKQGLNGDGEFAVLFEGNEKEAKKLFYSEEMFEKYPGGERGRMRRIARHGGARAGAGKKPVLSDPQVLSFKVDGEVAERIKARAASEGRSYADLLRDMVNEG